MPFGRRPTSGRGAVQRDDTVREYTIMSKANWLLIGALVLGYGITDDAAAKDRDKDKSKSKSAATSSNARFGGGGPEPGACTPAAAERNLDINRVVARAYNNGGLFYKNSVGELYTVNGESPIYASGIWIGGQRDGEVVTAGSTYRDYEFWPGPLDATGRPVNPADCSEYDRIYKVSRQDIQSFESTGNPARDLAEWPIELGAPVLAAPGNGFDDNGNGLVDEGSDGIDNDGDNQVDERDEQERVVIEVREAAGLPAYDLAAGDRPEIIGDQTLWWVMNDVGNVHNFTNSDPVGVEVRVQAFAFNQTSPLGVTTFWKYEVIYRGGEVPLEDTYLSIFSDPDLGDAGDDFVGTDVAESLGYVYNANPRDSEYPANEFAPAAGYDFFQGPIVNEDVPGIGDDAAPDTLGLAGFNYFINSGPDELNDPSNKTEMYNIMSGLSTTGVPITRSGDGVGDGGEPTAYAFEGDPVTGEFWSEVNADGAGNQTPQGPGDRRFVLTTGPFSLEPNVKQTIVFGITYGQAGGNFASIRALRFADRFAQEAYNLDFDIPPPPPAPPLCMMNAVDPELRPESGTCLEAVEVDNRVVLKWGYPSSSPNYNASFSAAGYDFEGFNIYRYTTSNFNPQNAELIGKFDLDNGITQISNIQLDPVTGLELEVPVQEGTDSGLQYYFEIPTSLDNNRDYFYGVSAYSYREDASALRALESPTTNIVVRPRSLTGIDFGGSQTQSDVGDLAVFNLVTGDSFQRLAARVVDPTVIRAATYEARIVLYEADSTQTFQIFRDGALIYDGLAIAEQTGRVPLLTDRIVIDGLSFFEITSDVPEADQQVAEGDTDVADFAGNGVGIGEVSAASGRACPAGSSDVGCQEYGVNTVFNNPDASNSYYIVDSGRNRLTRNFSLLGPSDYEIRFTEECVTSTCYGVYPSTFLGGNDNVAAVPFELWDIGTTPDDPSDDVRMIPFLVAIGEDANGDTVYPSNWANYFPDTLATPAGVLGTPGVMDPDSLSGITDEIYFFQPDRPDGYALFAAAAANSGGAGSTYVDEDTMEDPECSRQGYFADICFGGITNGFPVGKVSFADLDADGQTPEAGTTVRFITILQRAPLMIDDRLVLDTSELAFLVDQDGIAADALDGIGVVPNPYRARSEYERSSVFNDRRVRFIGLSEQATIRIYTVAGTLIRTLEKTGPSSTLDWDLQTENRLPVASGMYIIHVEARTGDGAEIGDKVLKLGVIQRNTRITTF